MEGRDPVKKDFYEVYSADIGKFDTNMGNLINFLHALHTSPSMLTVSRLNLSSVKESDKVRATMLITKLIMPTSRAPAEKSKQDTGTRK
jgi:hypothetical protein